MQKYIPECNMPENIPFPNIENPLDRIRLDKGNDGLLEHFTRLARKDAGKAMEHLNSGSVSFCTLYLLSRHIRALGLHARLNDENKLTLELSRSISQKRAKVSDLLTRNSDNSIHSAIKWIFESGCRDDGLDNKYDEIIELSALVLVRTFRDTSILNQISDLIFTRNRNGLFIHHLIWAFFEARVPYSLVLLANHLCSPVLSDTALALKLLRFIPCLSDSNAENAKQQYHNVLYWIEGNLPFLYYTGESFHQAIHPRPYAISLSARYLCSPVSIENGEPLRALDESEKAFLTCFEMLDASAKQLLSDFSYYLYRRNYSQWSMWIRYPITEQIRASRMAVGLT